MRPRPRPQQPKGHETKCPCFDCDAWAYDLIHWEEEEMEAGRDPWAEFRGRSRGYTYPME